MSNAAKTTPKRHIRGFFQSWMIVIILAVILVFFGLSQKSYLTFNSLQAICYNASIDAIACIGFTFLLIMGEIDMSIGAMACMGGALMSTLVLGTKLPLAATLVISAAAGGVLGYLQGTLITKFRLNSMMVTIGAMMALKAVGLYFVNLYYGKQLPSYAKAFAKFKLFSGSHKVYLIILIIIVLSVLFDFLLKKSKPFRQMYYIGNNYDTCALYGINANRVKRISFAFSGLMSALCGTFKTARFSHAAPDTGSNLEILIITAAVLGGASIYGGKGSVCRTLLGLVFIYALQTGLTSFDVDSYTQQVIIGAILIATIGLDIIMNKQTRKA